MDRFAAIASYTDRCDWGNVDPTQGPRFYYKALRKGWKRNLQADEYTIDPVPSPRKSNWFLLIKWFNLHLKRIAPKIPVTPPSTFEVNGKTATFTVTPEDRYNLLLNTEIYYSYNPNARTRFRNRADAGQDAGGKGRSAKLAIHKGLPLYSKDDKELEWSKSLGFTCRSWMRPDTQVTPARQRFGKHENTGRSCSLVFIINAMGDDVCTDWFKAMFSVPVR